ncbi:MAG: helix-turn-helix transcriptional regulator [Acidobacteria bacterium]|nr:helix-turn-helix transcriptional regulator [Acidobacteriota bacterium]
MQDPKSDPEDDRRFRIEFGRSLRAAREHAGLSQADVAARLDVTQPYVSHVERGQRNVTLSTIGAFARAVGCTFSIMLTPMLPPKD